MLARLTLHWQFVFPVLLCFFFFLPEESVASARGHSPQWDENTAQYADQLHRNIITERVREKDCAT